ncbi:MAG: ATPase, T2SS/T4P/T4SS family, partial [Candidatus Omnitrophica bacterium]|nr:ATPase, T2SS/T4P/T4SS family [Candidatus Omnitrophota bacterium]
MTKTDNILSEVLQEKNLITKEEIDFLNKEAQTQGISLKEILIKKSIFSEKQILEFLSFKLGISVVNLENLVSVERQVLERVPVRIASYYKFVPLQLKERTLTIAVSEPLDIKTQDEIRTQLGLDIEMVLACSEDIQEAINRNYGLAADIVKSTSKEKTLVSPVFTFQAQVEKIEDLERLSEDASVIKLVNQLILEAYRKRATDIHLEPYRDKVVLRYRIDGLLYDQVVPEELRNLYNAIISRIKIMSNLNIVERRLPQDGRAIVEVQEQVLDLRISTLPTPFGESVVIR